VALLHYGTTEKKNGLPIQRLFIVFFLLAAMALPLISFAVPAQAQTSQPQLVQQQNPQQDTSHISKLLIPKIENRINRYPTYFLFIFIGGFVLIAVIRLIDPPYLKNFIISSVNLKHLLYLFNEGQFGFGFTNLLLDVISISMLSIVIQQVFFPSQIELFVWILAFTFVGYFIKLIAIQLIANIFLDRGEAMVHLLMHLLYTRFIGLLLLPALFVALYQGTVSKDMLLHYIILGAACFYFVWLLRLYIKMNSMSISGVFYLFLYLCTIEISLK
jgi:hypothetical protein